MCGIAGIFSNTAIDASSIEGMVSTLRQRGPDAEGTFINPSANVLLGHTRLSIIDLTEQANQPFYSSSGRYVIVYNGEIYNYKQLRDKLIQDHGLIFKTNSDTEVIVEAFEIYGAGIAKYLDGMFSFAIYDHQDHQLFLLRDRMGKKPLFYFKSDSFFAFASEIKALLKIPLIERSGTINRSSISHFLHLGYIPEPDTIFKSINKFPAANFGWLKADNSFQVNKYWNITGEEIPLLDIDTVNAKASLRKILDQAVKKRLVGDVPIGSFLSGGTDSSLITALASRQSSQKMKTFSIGFKDRKFDEAEYARRVANHLGTDHHEYIMEERRAMEILPAYLNYFDEPFADPSAIPMMMVSEMARKQVKVVLTGDGGDELFQGYGAYQWAHRLELPFFKNFGSVLSRLLFATSNSRLQRISHILEPVEIGSIRSHIFSQEQYFFSQHEIRDKVLKNKNEFDPFVYSDSALSGTISTAEKQARFDLQYYLKDDLLVKVDRASMYHGLECRSPLLDKMLIEFALALPESMKRTEGVSKWLLKELLADYLPQDLIHRPKWGFSVPMTSWLRGDLRYLIDDYLNKAVLEGTGLFDADEVLSLVRQFDQGKDYLYQRLWVMIVLQRWFKLNT
ncbi:MAG: asparagine synthase (glutamine-hydrolyzing) [Cyclobacteriaceae bacterium]|nr:asparagine synthase (glutamine-hydrolyzing) [Cyclobacteriaceae bacterium]